ncbi:hypothetical protein EPN52_12525 [bacterium]|nr:MAG: hypothetical protein EPN52_12525 [bacterium]
MRIVVPAARIVLGFLFGVLGMNGFVPFMPNPTFIPPTAAAFAGAMASSHFSYFVFGVQVACGVLLLVNRWVPLAIVALAAVLANILAFHITMWPQTLVPMPLLTLILWFIVAWPLRGHFAPLFAATVDDSPTIGTAAPSAQQR